MVSELVKLLNDGKMKISTVESCTGGLIASSIVSVSGASNVFEYGFVTYSNAAKKECVGVADEIFEKYGAVSAECAYAMAKGGKKKADSHICISVTGVAGPSSDEGKEAGLVYIGVAYKETSVYECHFSGDRQTIREAAAKKAVELAIRTLKGE